MTGFYMLDKFTAITSTSILHLAVTIQGTTGNFLIRFYKCMRLKCMAIQVDRKICRMRKKPSRHGIWYM